MNAQPEKVKLLSPQQATIMQHLVDGLVIKEIATKMNLAASTVRQHIRKAKKKLGAGTQDRAIALAVALR
jgi:DNA-binding CsgD family transcriptional regulator